MKNAKFIEETIIELCDVIEMKRFGECQIVHFGEGNKEGYTAVLLIETSNITAHFANDISAIYFDIFSCKDYNALIVANFLHRKFEAEECNIRTTNRR